MFDPEERENVQELYARYAHTIDEGQFEQWADCFTDKGVFETRELGRFAGREALIKMARDFRAGLNGAQQRHMIDNVSFDLEGGRGTGTCNLSHFVTRDGVTQLTGVGVYRDKLRKVDGQWRFESRVVCFDTETQA